MWLEVNELLQLMLKMSTVCIDTDSQTHSGLFFLNSDFFKIETLIDSAESAYLLTL